MTTEERLTTKAQILKAIESLPEDTTIDEAIECLRFVAHVIEGREQARAGMLIPHEEVVKRFAPLLRGGDSRW